MYEAAEFVAFWAQICAFYGRKTVLRNGEIRPVLGSTPTTSQHPVTESNFVIEIQIISVLRFFFCFLQMDCWLYVCIVLLLTNCAQAKTDMDAYLGPYIADE